MTEVEEEAGPESGREAPIVADEAESPSEPDVDAEPAAAGSGGCNAQQPVVEMTCEYSKCHAPATGCLMGNLDWLLCERSGDRSAAAPPNEQDLGHHPSWTGLAMGTVDVEIVASVRRPKLIAVVGLASAGKTTALVAYFNRLRRGERIGGCSFAGSYSLLGWFEISQNLEFPPYGGRAFPPHTELGKGRQPSLLHVRLQREDGVLEDVLFTDLPGEWFEAWSAKPSDAPAIEWVAEHADVFALFSDSEALTGSERGKARSAYRNLANRVATRAEGRPVVPVRAKGDVKLSDPMNRQLQTFEDELFTVRAVSLSVYPNSEGNAELEPLDLITELACRRTTFAAPEEGLCVQGFLGFRSSQDNPDGR